MDSPRQVFQPPQLPDHSKPKRLRFLVLERDPSKKEGSICGKCEECLRRNVGDATGEGDAKTEEYEEEKLESKLREMENIRSLPIGGLIELSEERIDDMEGIEKEYRDRNPYQDIREKSPDGYKEGSMDCEEMVEDDQNECLSPTATLSLGERSPSPQIEYEMKTCSYPETLPSYHDSPFMYPYTEPSHFSCPFSFPAPIPPKDWQASRSEELAEHQRVGCGFSMIQCPLGDKLGNMLIGCEQWLVAKVDLAKHALECQWHRCTCGEYGTLNHLQQHLQSYEALNEAAEVEGSLVLSSSPKPVPNIRFGKPVTTSTKIPFLSSSNINEDPASQASSSKSTLAAPSSPSSASAHNLSPSQEKGTLLETRDGDGGLYQPDFNLEPETPHPPNSPPNPHSSTSLTTNPTLLLFALSSRVELLTYCHQSIMGDLKSLDGLALEAQWETSWEGKEWYGDEIMELWQEKTLIMVGMMERMIRQFVKTELGEEKWKIK